MKNKTWTRRIYSGLYIALTILFIYAGNLVAQSVVLCEKYDDYGTASGIYSAWDISSDGSYVYIVYKQPAALEEGTWYLYLDYIWETGGTYEPYETLEITPESGKTWFVYDFKFTDVGSYRAIVMHNGREQASTEFTIHYAEGEGPSSDSSGEISTYYYEDSQIEFCSSVDASGNPQGTTSYLSMNGTGTGTITIYLTNMGKPFKTNLMYIDIYKDDSDEVYQTFSVEVQPDWDYVNFKQTFTEAGNYFVDIYSADDIFINTSDTLHVTE